jgi:putative transcription factor
MRCEICGKVIKNEKPIKTKIDGAIFDVCEDCAKFGKVQKTPPKPKIAVKSRTKNVNVEEKKTPKYVFKDEPKDELVEEFNLIIKEKRENRGLSREQLARKINEKSSVISRVESGKMIPDIKLAKKFENALKITLIEKIGEFDLKDSVNSKNNKPTLGDFIKK